MSGSRSLGLLDKEPLGQLTYGSHPSILDDKGDKQDMEGRRIRRCDE